MTSPTVAIAPELDEMIVADAADGDSDTRYSAGHYPNAEYIEFLRCIVDAAYADIAAGRCRSHEEVAADRAAWRARIMASAKSA